MSRSREMAALVAEAALQIKDVVTCHTCAMGLATDMVGKIYGEEPYDWRGERFGHRCKTAVDGCTPAQLTALEAIEARLPRPREIQMPMSGTGES